MTPPTPAPSWDLEDTAGHPSVLIVGLDEVGRGCLAGAVVAGAVVPGVTRPGWLSEVRDSKLLTAEVRERLAVEIRSWARGWAVAEVSALEIDRINILRASHEAMLRAIAALPLKPERALVDGNLLPRGIRIPAQAVIKGDQKSVTIACASILAKVHRDQMMRELDGRYPGYGLAEHKGYPTPAHREALKRLGLTPEHRRSFGPVRDLLNPGADAALQDAEPAFEF